MNKNRNNYSNFKGKREKRGRERKRGAKKVQDRDLASKGRIHTRILSNQIVYAEYSSGAGGGARTLKGVFTLS